MNERIKELAEQAWIDNDQLDACGYTDLKKFAELIVKECLTKIENEAAQYAEPVWAVELLNDIKDHFGVK